LAGHIDLYRPKNPQLHLIARHTSAPALLVG